MNQCLSCAGIQIHGVLINILGQVLTNHSDRKNLGLHPILVPSEMQNANVFLQCTSCNKGLNLYNPDIDIMLVLSTNSKIQEYCY